MPEMALCAAALAAAAAMGKDMTKAERPSVSDQIVTSATVAPSHQPISVEIPLPIIGAAARSPTRSADKPPRNA